MVRLFCLAVSALAAAAPEVLSQSAGRSGLRGVLEASVAVEVIEGRYLSVSVDSVPTTVAGAGLINGYRRVFQYLVQHQVPAARLYDRVATASQPKAALIGNLLADSGATRSLSAYLARYAAAPNEGDALRAPDMISEAEALTIAGRFFHAVKTGERSVAFYRCAGINGIEGLGAARRPLAEAFIFWALAPSIFDADSASATARALNADFGRARAAFRASVEAAGYAPDAFASAQAALYRAMSESPALQTILRAAYAAEAQRLPFRVREWGR